MKTKDLDLLVESVVTALHFDRANAEMKIEVSCEWEDKPQMMIIASGIDDFILDDLREYNVIDRVSLFFPEESTGDNSDFISRLFFLMQKRKPTEEDYGWPALKEKLSFIRDHNLMLMEIEPVYGLSIVMLAAKIHVEVIGRIKPVESSAEGKQV